MNASTGSIGVLGEPRRAELLELVRSRGYAYRDEPFVLSSGGTSHDYVDLRRAVAHGSDLRLAATCVLETLQLAGIVFDTIGGMTMGADPVAHAVALEAGCSWFSVRKSEKSHGSGRRIEGAPLERGVRAVLFEDTVTTGRSLLEALDAVEASGASIVAACCLLERGEELAPVLAAKALTYLPLLSFVDLDIAPIGSRRPT